MEKGSRQRKLVSRRKRPHATKNIFFYVKTKKLQFRWKIPLFDEVMSEKFPMTWFHIVNLKEKCITISLLKWKISPSVHTFYNCASSQLELFCPQKKHSLHPWRWSWCVLLFAILKNKLYIMVDGYVYTVWKFQDFSIAQILREINFEDF